MQSPQWKFLPLQDGYPAQDPTEKELFKNEQTGGLVRALVRESVQNALDAKKQFPVRVHFSTVELSWEQYSEYMQDLLPHLMVADQRYVTMPDFGKPLRFLVIEDFNTTGLEGDPLITFLNTPQPGEDFYYFWRNIGRTGKRGSSRGSWGLGKAVFSAVSEISTLFGLTVRHSDRRRLLMGQSILSNHEIEPNVPIMPYGYFGVFDDRVGKTNFSKPIGDHDFTERFTRVFNLRRKPKEPGLSLIIPAPHTDINVLELLLHSIQEYFYPILLGHLVISVDGKIQYSEQKHRELRGEAEQKNIIQAINTIPKDLFGDVNFDKPAFLRLLNFITWSLRLSDTEYIQIQPKKWNSAPRWDKYETTEPLNLARERFAVNGRVAFRIPVPMRIEGKRSHEQGWFKVYVERDELLNRAESYFLRNGIWIKNVTGHKLRGIRGVVVIDGDEKENPLTSFLARAENPAHIEWQLSNVRHLPNGQYTLSFVRNSLSNIVNGIVQADKSIDENLLRDVFFIERASNDQRKHTGEPKTNKSRDGKPLDDFPDITTRSQAVRASAIKGEGGVLIVDSGDATRAETVDVQFAYAVRRGNAFQKYHPLDFDLSKMPIDYDSVEIAVCEQNRLSFRVRKQGFQVSVRGFDPLRDIEVRIHWKEVGE